MRLTVFALFCVFAGLWPAYTLTGAVGFFGMIGLLEILNYQPEEHPSNSPESF